MLFYPYYRPTGRLAKLTMAMNVYGSLESPPSGTPSNWHVNGGVSNKPESAATAPLVSEDKSAQQTRRRSHMKLGVAAAAAAAAALVAGAALLATTNQGGQPVDLLSELPYGEFVFSLTPWVCLHRGASLRHGHCLGCCGRLWSQSVAKQSGEVDQPYLATYFGPRCALARTRVTSNAAARAVSPGLYTGIYNPAQISPSPTVETNALQGARVGQQLKMHRRLLLQQLKQHPPSKFQFQTNTLSATGRSTVILLIHGASLARAAPVRVHSVVRSRSRTMLSQLTNGRLPGPPDPAGSRAGTSSSTHGQHVPRDKVSRLPRFCAARLPVPPRIYATY